MARPKLPAPVSEEVAQLRNTRQILFVIAREYDQRDRLIAASFDRFSAAITALTAQIAAVAERQTALDDRLTHIEDLFAQYAADADRAWLEGHGCVVQLNEWARLLRADVTKLPHLVAGAVIGAAPLAGGRPLSLVPSLEEGAALERAA